LAIFFTNSSGHSGCNIFYSTLLLPSYLFYPLLSRNPECVQKKEDFLFSAERVAEPAALVAQELDQLVWEMDAGLRSSQRVLLRLEVKGLFTQQTTSMSRNVGRCGTTPTRIDPIVCRKVLYDVGRCCIHSTSII
jgi:hypothetical protein